MAVNEHNDCVVRVVCDYARHCAFGARSDRQNVLPRCHVDALITPTNCVLTGRFQNDNKVCTFVLLTSGQR
jgi:hypothetical protein